MNRICTLITSLMLAITGCSNGDVNIDNQGTQASEDLLKVHFIDVGQGDSILITTPDGRNMLIDAGEDRSGAVAAYLRQQGVDDTGLDTVVATHPHSDHINAMDDVLNMAQVDHFYMPEVEHTTKDFENMLDALEDVPDLNYAKAGDTFTVGNEVECLVLSPKGDDYDNLNDYSVVLKLTYGDTGFIFTGDAEALPEGEILAGGGDIAADVLKVGHHGSSSSSTEEFVKAISPEYAVISCGKGNSYGHPHRETLATMEACGVEVLRTDELGTITLVSDGSRVWQEGDNQAVAEDTPESTAYIGNKNSKKFHREDCGGLPAEKNSVYFSSREEAVAAGYSPCGNCKP